MQLIENNLADDYIWSSDLWYQNRPHYQLRHNHCPTSYFLVNLFKNVFGNFPFCGSRTYVLWIITSARLPLGKQRDLPLGRVHPNFHWWNILVTDFCKFHWQNLGFFAMATSK